MALSVCQKYFNLYHNDLHLSNVMYNKTNDKFIYYSYNDIFFQIPTYNKVIKIIDWGRATYNFNNITGNNFIFRGDVIPPLSYSHLLYSFAAQSIIPRN